MLEKAIFRAARFEDLLSIVALLADDELGRTREEVGSTPAQCYVDAFVAISSDPNQLLAVAERGGRLAGVLQITFIPGLSQRGMWRGQIESVRIAATERNAGLGKELLEWAIAQCRSRGCRIVQLTSDKTREAAHRFYARLGFNPTHEGYKLTL
jgi:ribosomal protein S18 acetylase RimI-like enzyme